MHIARLVTLFANVCSINLAMLEFPAVGHRNIDASGTLYNAGTNGYYWSSVQSSTGSAHNMDFHSGSMNMNINNKLNGFSVRCVRQEFTTPILFSFIDIQAILPSRTAFCKRLLIKFLSNGVSRCR